MILIAGGTGTVGRILVPMLLSDGLKVRVLTRSQDSAAKLRALGVETVLGDAGRDGELRDAVSGCGAIVSAMSGFGPTSGSSPDAVDRSGNIALMDAAAAAGVKRFVLFSIRGAAPDSPLPLARCKFAAEQHLKNSPLAWTILRPTTILETFASVLRDSLNQRGAAVIFGRGDRPINFVSAADLAAAARLALRDPGLISAELELKGPENLSLNELAELLIAQCGSGRMLHLPLPMLRALAALATVAAPAWGRMLRTAVLMCTTDMSCDLEPDSHPGLKLTMTPASQALAAAIP
ncbi:SDR family oxidoreductase [Paenarthrobacter sp. Z7-10]|uniref:SDR family oxidoreductase n=1 Tax=Paenarthrobacter sp. Z7-10 TaxID=2787635 RepID=UPI0022A97ED7|nr:SDR family oxidoreductase [Paenarthrobacter sp. Z7-10]MCZ2404651.1 SDR family oxidoreductase [Paenarthrobacter sp. Z7-10]